MIDLQLNRVFKKKRPRENGCSEGPPKFLKISKKIGQKGNVNVADQILPVLNKLTMADWFTARLSVCALFPYVYPKCSDEQQAAMRINYGELCNDETPMVRRAAALKLKGYINNYY